MMANGTAEAEAALGYLTPLLRDYLQDLRALCAIECPSTYKRGVDEAGDWVRAWAETRAWSVRCYPDDRAGNSVVVTLNGGAPRGPNLLLAAHLDTVYPVGTAAARPLRQEGDHLLAPGSADNKSGLLSGLYALAALQDLGWLEPFSSASLVCGGDEETDMRSSLGLLRELAPRHDAAFVLEAARENGDIVGARKTGAHFLLEVRGREAHAGVEPYKGANAILALAEQVVALQALNGMRPGVTVNVGVVEGGTLSNVVPGNARAEIDVRAEMMSDMEPVRQAIAQIAANTYVPGTTSTLQGGWKAPPMPITPEGAALAALAQSCAAEVGIDLGIASTGGISYANHLAGLGLPVLDGLGPIGGLDHSPEEYIALSSIIPRTALLTLLMRRRAEGGGRSSSP